MATDRSTVADLRKAGTIKSSEIVAAIDAYLRLPDVEPYRFLSGHVLDLAAAAEGIIQASETIAGQGRQDKTYRNAVTVAVMSARPASPKAGNLPTTTRTGQTRA